MCSRLDFTLYFVSSSDRTDVLFSSRFLSLRLFLTFPFEHHVGFCVEWWSTWQDNGWLMSGSWLWWMWRESSELQVMSRTAPSAINHQRRTGILRRGGEPSLALPAITGVTHLTRAECWFESSCGPRLRCLWLCPRWEERKKTRPWLADSGLADSPLTPSHSSSHAPWLPDGGVNINDVRPGGFSRPEYWSARLKFTQSAAWGIKTSLLFASRGNDSQSQVFVIPAAWAQVCFLTILQIRNGN